MTTAATTNSSLYSKGIVLGSRDFAKDVLELVFVSFVLI